MILISPNDSPSVFDIHSGKFLFDNLNKYKNETILVNLASEHWGEEYFFHRIYKELEENQFDFWILSHHPGDHKKLDRLVYYPWYHVYSRLKFSSNIDIKKNRKFSLGCLHGNPRPHRIVNYFALEDRFAGKKIYNTIHDSYPLPSRNDDPGLTIQEQNRWENFRHNCPDRRNIKNDTDLTVPAFSSSYIHLVSETTVIDRIFITEKTWKPIVTGQLFLILGNPGVVSHLRELGVDMFDDIIDHDYYDHCQDWRSRLDRIHETIDNLLKEDLENIWNATYERRKENQKRFFSGDFKFKHVNTFDDLLEKHYVPYRRISSLDAESRPQDPATSAS